MALKRLEKSWNGGQHQYSFRLAKWLPFRSSALSTGHHIVSRSAIVYVSVVLTLSLFCLRYYIPSATVNRIQSLDKIEVNTSETLISPKIWQIMLPRNSSEEPFVIDPGELVDTTSWLAKNPDHAYKLITSGWADTFVSERYASSERIRRAFQSLRNPGLKSDLLRYLVLSAEGGVYTDVDTLALKRIDDWVPSALHHRVRLVVGIEFDRLDGSRWADIPHELQFCQWTIAAAPDHPVFPSMVSRALDSLDDMARRHNATSPGQLSPSSFEVMNSTGPAAWTDVVFRHIQLADPAITTLRNLSAMAEPTLYGDILVLPIDGFGMGQAHSNSTSDGSIPDSALVKHNFRGSWRNG